MDVSVATIRRIKKLRPTHTIRQISDKLKIPVRKLERLLAKYKIKKYK